MAKGRPLIRNRDDQGRVRAFLEIRLGQVRELKKKGAGVYTTARLAEREDLLLEVWGVLLQGTRTATVFADGGPVGGETAKADTVDTEP